MIFIGRVILIWLVVALTWNGAVGGVSPAYAETPSSPVISEDIYYQTEGTPSGPSARSVKSTYPDVKFIDNRVLVWVVMQQHTYFGGFVLALPFFAVLLEFLGLTRRDPDSIRRYDGLAHDIIRVAVVSLSFTAFLGAVVLGIFINLYPGFMSYMGSTFKSLMPMYAGVFVSVSFLLVLYYYSWDYLSSPGKKWIHMAIGVLVNVMGAVLLFSANAWASFMMAPAGVDADGRFLGNIWNLMHSPLWNPLNTHRFLADIMSGGAVVVAYAAYRYLTTRSEKERAYYDWVGYVFILVVVCALLPMPIAGYWLMKAVFQFRSQMGVTMMGGLLSWMFVIQAITIGVLFLGINYYIWQSLGRVKGGERFHSYFRVITFAMLACFIVWFTPHTIATTPTEMKAMGAAQHPVIGQFGVMSAKNGAINLMICLTALSYLLYRRANYVIVTPWARRGDIALVALFTLGMMNILWLAIYGFYIPANVRVGLSMPQGVTTATVVLGGLAINYLMLRHAKAVGPIAWGKISVRGMVVLFGVAAAFTWVMGLMGYIRSAGRLGWHVNELLQDVSPWSFTPAISFAAKMVTVNMVLYWTSVFFMFWLSRRDYQTAEERIETRVPATPLVQSLSREETSV